MNARFRAAEDTVPVSRIVVSNVSLALGGRSALSGVNLNMSARRIAVVGRNGSGKSTLARVLCGLIAPDQGSVLLNGVDVLNDRRGALRQVGILFQNPEHQILFPTVGEEVAFGLRQLGQSRQGADQQARDVLAGFGRADWFDRSVSSLSQGQKHLLCLISVLAMKPALLVLDEPFAGLDIPTTRALTRLLEKAAPSIVHISHDPQILERYDQVVWMDNGQIAAQGSARPVLDRFMSAMVSEEQDDAFADLAG